MNKWGITQWLIFASVVIWIAWDFYTFYAHGNPTTESAVIIRWNWYHPWIPFLAGVLVGHLFFDLREPISWPKDLTKKDPDGKD